MFATATTARTLRFTPCTDPYSPTAGALEIQRGKARTVYVVCEYPSSVTGRAFQLTKLGGDSSGYAVIASHRGAEYDACECPAFLRKCSCKHTAAIRKLLDLGRL